MRLGGLRAVGPSAVRVPGGVMPQRPPGIPHSQAARGYRAFRLRLNSGAAFMHQRCGVLCWRNAMAREVGDPFGSSQALRPHKTAREQITSSLIRPITSTSTP
jgi:hypothetical protein